MIHLGYIGTHKGDKISQRIGWAAIRWAQSGYSSPAKLITHTEIMTGGTPESATISSSSLADGGVRTKYEVALKAHNWRAIYVPCRPGRDTQTVRQWFAEHDGLPYDTRGAGGSVAQALLHQREGTFFCSEACAESIGMPNAHMLCPAAWWSVLLFIGGVDVTDDFFGGRFDPGWL